MLNKAEEFLEYVKENKSTNTFNVYRQGLKKFLEWIQKDPDEIIRDAKQRFLSEDREIREFWKMQIEMFRSSLLKEGLTKNSARTQATAVVAFFRHYGLSYELEKDFWQVQVTAKDFIPSIEELRRMFNVANIREKIVLSLGLDLGLRIGDFSIIKKAELPDLSLEAPISFDRLTRKENIVAKGFISIETVELLKAYLPTLKAENEYLFPSNGDYLKENAFNDALKSLAKKAKLKIPVGKRLRFHFMRKKVYSNYADNKVNIFIANSLIGKANPVDKQTYLGDVNLKTAFETSRARLKLSNGQTAIMQEKDAIIEAQRKEIEQLKFQFKLLADAQSEQIKKTLLAKLKAEGYKETVVFGGKPKATVQINGEKVEIEPIHDTYTVSKLLEKLALIEQLKLDVAFKKGLEEINEENGNHNGES
jgi:integrase